MRLCKLYSARGTFDSSLELIANASSSHKGRLFGALFEGQGSGAKLPDDPRLLDLVSTI